MRAVILADFAVPSGGAQKVALESARALAEAGVAVTYLHAVGAADPLLDHPAIEAIGLGLPDIWDRPLPQAAVAGVWNGAAARRVAAILRALPPGPTVVHLHQWTRAFSPAVLRVLAGSGLPLAVTLHDYFLACPNGVYYRFDRDAPCSLTPLSAGCLVASCDPKSPWHKAVRVARSLAVAAAIRGRAFDLVHVSDRGRDTIAPFLPADFRHHRVDNPIPIARGEPAAIGAGARIAYIGRLTREKGADLVALAARRAGLPALFVGEGPLANEIRAIDPEAEMPGWLPPADLERLLRSGVRAVAAPSRWYETGPMTVYEAMAAGVPAVASARSGAAEKVADGETGFVVGPDADALAAAFRRLADDATARRLGAAAYRRYWADPPSPAAHARRTIALYEAMLARAGIAAPDPDPMRRGGASSAIVRP